MKSRSWTELQWRSLLESLEKRGRGCGDRSLSPHGPATRISEGVCGWLPPAWETLDSHGRFVKGRQIIPWTSEWWQNIFDE